MIEQEKVPYVLEDDEDWKVINEYLDKCKQKNIVIDMDTINELSPKSKITKKLTEEQIKTLEYVFASYPENWVDTYKRVRTLYHSMEGVQKQIKISNEKTPHYSVILIFYAEPEYVEGQSEPKLTLKRMEVRGE